MATNDDKGYERGARGICGRDGENFVSWGKPEGVCKVTGSDGGAAAGANKAIGAIQSSANGKYGSWLGTSSRRS